MTVTASARPERPQGVPAAVRVAVALVAAVTVITVGLAGLFATAASARPLTGPETRVGAFGLTGGQIVGAHEPVLAGQRRARAPSYDRTVVGSCVAAETASGPGGASLDTNVLIRGLDNGELEGVDKALAGRIPNVSPTAAEEYLTRGSPDALDQFLADRGGSIAAAGTPEGAAALQTQATGLGRALGLNDALIADSAMQEGTPLITGDQQLLRFLGAIGYPAEGF